MGTDAWRNWNAFNDGSPEGENADDELNSNRHLVGGLSIHDPYTLTPTTGRGLPSATPAVRLHTSVHANLIPDIVVDGALESANSDAYPRGAADDEVAALALLELGVRLRVAGTSQLSDIHRDGEEHSPNYRLRPHLPPGLIRPPRILQVVTVHVVVTASSSSRR